ncbi:MAG: CRISPR-associated endonuclease Cas2 [Candidatus Methylacidiphilales bacterium]|nr:CRISPR-associated endonuclease Cas2 [Candidatus Methylacidiphilales bacterium]
MRYSYLVCYDISNDKRLRQVFKICRNHGNHLQYSIFECDLNAAERIDLEQQLSSVIHHGEDQVLFVCLGRQEARGSRDITALGIPYTRFDEPCYVV